MNKQLYFHINNVTGEVFYVGIGNPRRAYSKYYRSKFWHNIVNKYGYDIIIEETNLTHYQACELEIYWIKRIGRRDLGLGTLVNHTDGGDGLIGHKHTQETKDKISSLNTGKTRSIESKLKMSESRKGKKFTKHSEESKKNMSLAQIGKPRKKHSEETKLKMRQSRIAFLNNQKNN